jgi:hypothetical protein
MTRVGLAALTVIALVAFGTAAEAQTPAATHDAAAPPRHARRSGRRAIVIGAFLFTLGHTPSQLLAVGGAVACASGHSFDCPLLFAALPGFGMTLAVVWSSALMPPRPGTVDDGSTYLLIGAFACDVLDGLGTVLAIHGLLRERAASLHGERIAGPRWALLPGPGSAGLSLAIVTE